MILPEHDPEDIISPQTSTIVAEPPSQIREEEKEETMVLVEEVPTEHNVFRDGSLCVYQVSIYLHGATEYLWIGKPTGEAVYICLN